VLSQGTLLGGGGRSWTVPTYILNGNFPDGFPQDEDLVPLDGVSHPVNVEVNEANADAPHGWQHELHGAAPHVHANFGLNAAAMEGVQQDLEGHIAQANQQAGWDAWPADDVVQGDNLQMEDAEPQYSISFDQSGSTTNYLRANGPDIALNIDDVLAGNFGVGSSSSSSSDATSAEPEVQSAPSFLFQAVEMAAFQHLMFATVPPALHFPLVINPSHMGSFGSQQ
jgi:hypothetical protein